MSLLSTTESLHEEISSLLQYVRMAAFFTGYTDMQMPCMQIELTSKQMLPTTKIIQV